MEVTALDRRTPGTSLPPEAYRAVGRASVRYGKSRWSSDETTLERILVAMLPGGPGHRRIEDA